MSEVGTLTHACVLFQSRERCEPSAVDGSELKKHH